MLLFSRIKKEREKMLRRLLSYREIVQQAYQRLHFEKVKELEDENVGRKPFMSEVAYAEEESGYEAFEKGLPKRLGVGELE